MRLSERDLIAFNLHYKRISKGIFRNLTRTRSIKRLLDDLNESTDVALVSYICQFLNEKNSEIVSATVEILARCLKHASSKELLLLDEELRRYSDYWYSWSDWLEMKPSNLNKFKALPDFKSVLYVGTFHPSGYVRQDALRRLSKDSMGSDLPYILIRLNDWVTNVREEANSTLNQYISEKFSSDLLQNVELITRLLRSGREDHRNLTSKMAKVIVLSQPDELNSGIVSDDFHYARACFHIANSYQKGDKRNLIKLGLSASDNMIKLWSSKQIVDHFSGDELNTILNEMANSKCVALRRDTIYKLVDIRGQDSLAILKQVLLDQHGGIRSQARFYMKKFEPEFDFAGFYREQAKADSPTPTAIKGLAETGDETDVDFFVSMLDSKLQKIRRAALYGIILLRKDDDWPLFIDILNDPNAGISKDMRNCLIAKSNHVPFSMISRSFSESEHSHSKKNALIVATHCTKWNAISVILKALSDPDPDILDMAMISLHEWIVTFNKSQSSPAPEQLEAFRNLYELVKAKISQKSRRFLEFLMK